MGSSGKPYEKPMMKPVLGSSKVHPAAISWVLGPVAVVVAGVGAGVGAVAGAWAGVGYWWVNWTDTVTL